MPNRHKDIFIDYLDNHNLANLYEVETINVLGEQRSIIRCASDDELLGICKDLAVEKARFTMDQNQAGVIHSQSEKEAKQFEGVLAETMSHILLLSELEDCSVIRFDLERNNFVYDPNEYDIVLDDGINQYEFEIRNSYSYKTTIEEAYATLDILGAYTNGYKPQETLSDL